MANDTQGAAATPEARLAALGIVLPEPAAPIASYVPSVEANGLIHISLDSPIYHTRILKQDIIDYGVWEERPLCLV